MPIPSEETPVEQRVEIQPWRSIRAGSRPRALRTMSFHDGLASPCATCATSPCCTHLPIHTFTTSTVGELSYAAYLANFDRIRLGIKPDGEWSAYYVHPCRFLDRDTMGCTVHDQPAQPQICRTYNPYNCWYERNLTSEVADGFLQVDRARLDWLLDHVTVDEHRDVVSMPPWDDLQAAFVGLGDPPSVGADDPPADPAFDEWERAARTDPDVADRWHVVIDHRFDDPAVVDPCTGCSAPCCETLTFPQGPPTSRSALDFLQFALGFPGVEAMLTDSGWWLVVRTRCRHLAGGRCGVFGRPERPLFCRYYDERTCTYRTTVGTPRPAGSFRIRLEHLAAVAECLRFDGSGTVTSVPPVEDIRRHVEARLRADHLAHEPASALVD